MGKYVMTARRKAALKKAQLASARKRKKRARAITKGKRKAYMKRAKAAYPVKNNPGRIYRMNRARTNSTGVFAKHPSGRNWTKREKRVNKVAGNYISYVAGANALLMGGSYVRGRRKGTIKKRNKRKKR
jgi:hypothetical protein